MENRRVPSWRSAPCTLSAGRSSERYQTQDELVTTAREYRQRKIPLDVIVQDWKYWPKGIWSEKYFEESRYPDPAKMLKDLHDMDLKLMISIWPFARGGENRKELKASGLNLTCGSTFDAFSQAGRDLYWKQADEGLFKYGVDAWWADCTGPGGPYWTYDIGAFFVIPEKKYWRTASALYPMEHNNLGYRELYTRWFQAGAFAPLCRQVRLLDRPTLHRRT